MKKVFKRAIPFVLVVVMCIAMAVPASAYTTDTTFTSFATQVQGNVNGYVGLIQAIMYGYNSTTRNYLGYKLADGEFGTGTYNAVRAFQVGYGFTGGDIDGKVGPKTWVALRNQLSSSYKEDSFLYYYVNGSKTMRQDISTGYLRYYNYGDAQYHYVT